MGARLVIVDDHALIRQGFARTIESQPDLQLVGEAATAAEGWVCIGAVAPDVAVIDTGLPDRSGIALAAELRVAAPGLGIVLLASAGDDGVVLAALDAGASAVVSKTAPVEHALAAVRHAAVAPTAFVAEGLAGALARSRAGAQAKQLLSPRELEVLLRLGVGMSVPAVARALNVSPSTAKTYVARLYEKLGAANRAQALVAALRLGLVSSDELNAGQPRERLAYATAGREV